jgi:CRISPR-associated exonuclease Cas4
VNINGTLINYYVHCKRQCYLHGNRLNLEDNSENVKIGKALHEEKANKSSNAEIQIDNIKIDKLTKEYITEIKKSDADIEATRWQLLFYMSILKKKGIERKGRIEFAEKNQSVKKTIYVELTTEIETELNHMESDILSLIEYGPIPIVLNQPTCRKCAYYEYCYI